MHTFISLCILVLLSATDALSQKAAYYRQPAFAKTTVAFASEGDLWTVPLAGGEARRLTSHQGEEGWPVLSPDGTQIAFTAQYQGQTDVYVMPVLGGTPKRISWLSGRPVAWASNQEVLVQTRERSGLPQTRLVRINVESKAVKEVPLAEAADAAVLADKTLVFARLPRQGSNARFYKGGTAPKLWSYKSGADAAVPLTADYPGSSRQPVAMSDGRVYFLSDRADAMNIWSMTATGEDLRQHTNYSAFDIQELTGADETLVFRKGADLFRYRLGTGAPEKINITLRSDAEQSLLDYETKPLQRLSATAISANGEQVALVSRGELFIAPAGAGRLVQAAPNSGVRYRDVVFGPDSASVYALSDQSGELEWWKVATNGAGTPERVTDGPAILRSGGTVSPDGKWMAHHTYRDGVYLVNLTTKTTTRIADDMAGGYAWSPNSRYLVYTGGLANQRTALFVYDTQTKSAKQISTDAFDDNLPAFSPDGDWLFFQSSRHWNSEVGSPWGERAPQPHFDATDGIYALPLRATARWPFTPDNELTGLLPKDTMKLKQKVKLPMDFTAMDRLRRVPIKPANLRFEGLTDKRLFYRMDGTLHGLAMKPEAKPVKIAKDVASCSLSADGKKLLIEKRKGGRKLFVIASDAGKDADLSKAGLRLAGWRFAVDKRAEWNQIYADAWRLHRDYFWDPDMHGVDWKAMREKYKPQLARVGSRNELNDVIGQLISELSLLHSNARGGDVPQPKVSVSVGRLGGSFVRSADGQGFRLEKRYDGHPDQPDTWGPLQHPDVRMEVGDVLLSIDGRSLANVGHPGELLLDKVDKHVLLEFRDGKTGSTRQVLAKAISPQDAYRLRYEDWEQARRHYVDSLSDASLGYVHIQTMGRRDIGRWTRDFYGQLDKEGLVIDVRHNFGGNIDSWILGQLLRRAWSYFNARGATHPYPNMQESFNGPLVVLTDHWTASDGEAFADGFKRLGLGHTIGTRTWGGEVWLTSSNRQVDGGIARASEFGVFSPEGEWLIEGWGFVPDEIVDNEPHQSYLGKDAQLEAAVKHLQAELKRNPPYKPVAPPYPRLIPGKGFPVPWK